MDIKIYPIGSVFKCGESKVMNVGYCLSRDGSKLRLAYRVTAWPQGGRTSKQIANIPVEGPVLYWEAPHTEASESMVRYLTEIYRLTLTKSAYEVLSYIDQGAQLLAEEGLRK